MKKKYIKKTFEPYLYISSTLKPAYKNNKLWPIRADTNYQIKSSYRNQNLFKFHILHWLPKQKKRASGIVLGLAISPVQ